MRTASTIALLLLAGCKSEGPAAPLQKPFEVAGLVQGPVQVGDGGVLELKLVAREGYKVNSEYPVNFKPQGSSDSLSFESQRFDFKDAAEAKACASSPKDVCELRAKVPFAAKAEGPARVAGVLAFSVCNPDACLIEKLPVSVEVEVR
jgi:hypothetical protein